MSLSRELIVAAKARADAATEGPWGYYTPSGGGSNPVFGAIPGDEVAVVKRPNDWRLIAAARVDVPEVPPYTDEALYGRKGERP